MKATTLRTHRVARPTASALTALLLGLLVAHSTVIVQSASAATIVIVNNDAVGEGFNDSTPVSPVGGNPGTTRGAQRLFIFQSAAAIWGSFLPSTVTIRVLAQFNPQTCGATSAVLGSAGARSVSANFPGAPFANTWYCQALANKISGFDQDPTLEDINATFNSDVDNSSCLGSVNWYYGIDGQEGTNIELLPVVLHELGHGLGFQTFANTSTGAFLNGIPDVFARFLLDKSTGLHWDQLSSNSARKSSAVNTGNLVWDGPQANARAGTFLLHEPEVHVSSPASIAGDRIAAPAEFGPPLSAGSVTANIALVNDGVAATADACEAIQNRAALVGRIALIDRGTCSFVSKVAAAQASGAVGVIVVNNVAGAPISMSGSDPSVTIPSVMISQTDGATIKSALASGAVNVTLRPSATRIAGVNPTGGVKMYAPSTLEPGSSVSHFDVSATPDVLMEPAINTSLHDDVDLTHELLVDIGWLSGVTGVTITPTAPAFRVRSAPNPFAPSTAILLDLPSAGSTRVEVYDIQGRLVKHLMNSWLPAGQHAITWDGTDDRGQAVGSGVYFSRVLSNGARRSERLVKVAQ